MRDERVLITGCGGMLGNAVYPHFISRFRHVLATDRDISEPWLQALDVRDDRRLQEIFRDFRPDIVLHLAAETDLEFCETHPDTAEDTNALATAAIARLCHMQEPLWYMSALPQFSMDAKTGSTPRATNPAPS